MGQSWPLFVYFRPFLVTILIIQIEKSVDAVHDLFVIFPFVAFLENFCFVRSTRLVQRDLGRHQGLGIQEREQLEARRRLWSPADQRAKALKRLDGIS